MKKRFSVWDILAWIALASIIIWGILKVTGIINTPLFIEYYPLFAVSYVFGWQMNKLNNVAKEVEGLKSFKNETIKQIHEIKENCARKYK
jgi:hypothetical protein